MKRILRDNLINIPGWRTKRRIVVFQSDDWGSNRMPSKKIFHKLSNLGLGVETSHYNRFDTLENREDLYKLISIISKFKDRRKNYPIFTFNTIMGNPDYEKIEEYGFNQFHFENLFESYQRYHGEDLKDLWLDAVDEKVIHPQFHGREHVNVSLWMKALRLNYEETKIAFNNYFYGLKTSTPSNRQSNYLAAQWPESSDELDQIENSIKEGLQLFEQLFGFPSKSFVACNYIYPSKMEEALSCMGIDFIQTQNGHYSPSVNGYPSSIKRHYTGQKNLHEQYYIVRNCLFEPVMNRDKDWVSSCLKQIKYSFRWNKPAVISTHRINYVSSLSEENRKIGLSKLETLLSAILNKWPDVEFMSTHELGILMEENS